MSTTLTSSPAWQALKAHHSKMASTHMRDLFAQDAKRFDGLHAQFEDIRRRVPSLHKLRQQIAFQPQFDLEAIIRDVQAWQLGR